MRMDVGVQEDIKDCNVAECECLQEKDRVIQAAEQARVLNAARYISGRMTLKFPG